MIRTILVDDDIHSCQAARASLSEFPDVEILGTYERPDTLFAALRQTVPDLIFLDIELGRNSGFDIARRLHEDYPDLLFIFLTGHASYAIDGYGFHPVDFLTKPIRREKMADALSEVRRRMGVRRDAAPKGTELMFRLNSGYRLIGTGEIILIERRDRRNIMALKGEALQIGRYSMKELEDMLEDHGFMLCHQSFLINLSFISCLGDSGRQQYYLKMKGYPDIVPVSRNKYEELLQRMKQMGRQLL